MTVLYDVAALQSILAEEHHGSNLTYEVVERPASTDNWTVVETLPSEKSSSRFKLRSIPVELAILSKNEIGAARPLTVFGISSAVLSKFLILLVFVFCYV